MNSNLLATSPVKQNIKELIGIYKKAIDAKLIEFFDNELASMLDAEISVYGTEAIELLRESTLGSAKRIRGSLTCLAYDAFAGTHIGDAGIRAAVSTELIQIYLLIVDDVADKSDLRRGLPALHKRYELKSDYDEHKSQMLAIMVALLAQHIANLIIEDLSIDDKCIVAGHKVMHKNVLRTGFGQIDDIAQKIQDKISEQDILHICRMKTGYYTFANPLQLGAALAGQYEPEFLEEVEIFAQNAGVAFQLRDDVLGLYGDTIKTGKSVNDDINEGKNTLLFQYALNHNNKANTEFLKSRIGCGSISESDAVRVRELVESCGALEYVEEKIKNYATDAIKIIEESRFWDDNIKNMLIELVRFSSERDV